jgi:hypothetical protein
MDVYSDSDTQAFRQHATLLSDFNIYAISVRSVQIRRSSLPVSWHVSSLLEGVDFYEIIY